MPNFTNLSAADKTAVERFQLFQKHYRRVKIQRRQALSKIKMADVLSAHIAGSDNPDADMLAAHSVARADAYTQLARYNRILPWVYYQLLKTLSQISTGE